MLNKFISILLAVVMSFQVAPLSVFAAERSSNIAEDSQSNVSLKQSLAEIIEETKTIIPEDLKNAGRKTVKSFDTNSRFFHCEFFRLFNAIIRDLSRN